MVARTARTLKVSILGGGGSRTPLLARALAGSRLGVRELALYDTNRKRLAAIAQVVRAIAPRIRLRVTHDPGVAVRGCRFVIAAIRAGGQEARSHDEQLCVAARVLGQETVGAAGAALAMRNIPPMVRLARIMEREAPGATLINYTNPAGMVTEALLNETSIDVIGICDTPAELTHRVADLLYLDRAACSVAWSGINHLGWLTGLYEADPTGPLPPENHLEDLFRDPGRLVRVYPNHLFEASEMVGAIPSEYVYLHLHAQRAVLRTRAAGTTRGASILSLEGTLFSALEAAAGDRQRAHSSYWDFINARSASYFQIETRGDVRPAGKVPRDRGPTGYDRIGLAVMKALAGDEPVRMVVNTRNRTASGGLVVPELLGEDVVEVAAQVGSDGVSAVPQPPLPVAAGNLLRRVKETEREFVRAALARDPGIAAEALREHPAGGAAAARIFGQLQATGHD